MGGGREESLQRQGTPREQALAAATRFLLIGCRLGRAPPNWLFGFWIPDLNLLKVPGKGIPPRAEGGWSSNTQRLTLKKKARKEAARKPAASGTGACWWETILLENRGPGAALSWLRINRGSDPHDQEIRMNGLRHKWYSVLVKGGGGRKGANAGLQRCKAPLPPKDWETDAGRKSRQRKKAHRFLPASWPGCL